jgi:hypothetical protein
VDPETGLSALHIAVGNNDIVLCRFLIEQCGARFGLGSGNFDSTQADAMAQQDASFVKAMEGRLGASPTPRDVLNAYRVLGSVEEIIADQVT